MLEILSEARIIPRQHSKNEVAELELPACNFSDYNSESDENFDPEHEVLDEDEQIKNHATEWILALSRMILCHFVLSYLVFLDNF